MTGLRSGNGLRPDFYETGNMKLKVRMVCMPVLIPVGCGSEDRV